MAEVVRNALAAGDLRLYEEMLWTLESRNFYLPIFRQKIL
jgi:hypothetical protein